MGRITRRKFLASAGELLLCGAAAIATGSLDSDSPRIPLDLESEFFVIGDLHHKQDEGYSTKTSRILNSLKLLSGGSIGMHVIFNGDMIHFPRNATRCKDQEEQWEEFAKLYLSLKEAGFVPHVVFGNHDGPREIAKLLLSGIVSREEMEDYVLALNSETKLIMLSAPSPALVDAGFLKRELSLDIDMKKIVLSHFPPEQLSFIPGLIYKKNAPKGLWQAEGVLEAISGAGAPLISSHSHTEFAGEYRSGKLKNAIGFVGTPSVYRPLEYWGTKVRAKRALGITRIDSRNVVEGAKFFDGWKRMWKTPAQVKTVVGQFESSKSPMKLGRRA